MKIANKFFFFCQVNVLTRLYDLFIKWIVLDRVHHNKTYLLKGMWVALCQPNQQTGHIRIEGFWHN